MCGFSLMSTTDQTTAKTEDACYREEAYEAGFTETCNLYSKVFLKGLINTRSHVSSAKFIFQDIDIDI